jgi:hypothetical protein
MTVVDIDLRPRPVGDDDVLIVEDVDELVAANKCSCAAGDDQPY